MIDFFLNFFFKQGFIKIRNIGEANIILVNINGVVQFFQFLSWHSLTNVLTNVFFLISNIKYSCILNVLIKN